MRHRRISDMKGRAGPPSGRSAAREYPAGLGQRKVEVYDRHDMAQYPFACRFMVGTAPGTQTWRGHLLHQRS